MFRKKERFSDIGKIKRDTNSVVEEALEKQLSWKRDKRNMRGLVPAKKNARAVEKNQKVKKMNDENKKSKGILRAYWFPILCAIIILILIAWLFVPGYIRRQSATVPEPTTNTITSAISESNLPRFDVVRIEKNGHIVLSGRYKADTGVSVSLNNKIVATKIADKNGEFVYAPSKHLEPGNYVLQLIAVDTNLASENKVFLYISEKGDGNSLSLLMTKDGSTMLQSPKLEDGDLIVSKIDYLKNGRIVAMGRALPRLRVSLVLDGKELGFARVSDHKNFGLGAHVGELNPGQEYTLSVRLHDGDGENVAKIVHKFVMPEPTGKDDTFYTVRRGDALWIIARNFLGRGVLFSIIAEKNSIENPDLIYPNQKLQIPVE